MKIENKKRSLLLICVTGLLVACGGTPERTAQTQPPVTAPTANASIESGVVNYVVRPGDSLGNIARQITGNPGNWRAIADFNNITNPRQLRVGKTLEIPTDMIPGYQQTPAPIIQSEPVSQVQDTPSSSLAVRRNEPVDTAPVVVTPITANRDFELRPIDSSEEEQPRNFVGTGKQIKVNGSYFPKGIYDEPAAYSRLIMRVAPGTTFGLDSRINEWYKIETERGTGYIRVSDADIIE